MARRIHSQIYHTLSYHFSLRHYSPKSLEWCPLRVGGRSIMYRNDVYVLRTFILLKQSHVQYQVSHFLRQVIHVNSVVVWAKSNTFLPHDVNGPVSSTVRHRQAWPLPWETFRQLVSVRHDTILWISSAQPRETSAYNSTEEYNRTWSIATKTVSPIVTRDALKFHTSKESSWQCKYISFLGRVIVCLTRSFNSGTLYSSSPTTGANLTLSGAIFSRRACPDLGDNSPNETAAGSCG